VIETIDARGQELLVGLRDGAWQPRGLFDMAPLSIARSRDGGMSWKETTDVAKGASIACVSRADQAWILTTGDIRLIEVQ
jgi:hypothetical protein